MSGVTPKRSSFPFPREQYAPARTMSPFADSGDISAGYDSQETIRPYREASPLPQKKRAPLSRSSTANTIDRNYDIEMQRLRDGGLIPLQLGPPIARAPEPPPYPFNRTMTADGQPTFTARAKRYAKEHPTLIAMYCLSGVIAVVTFSLAVGNYNRLRDFVVSGGRSEGDSQASASATAAAAAAYFGAAASATATYTPALDPDSQMGSYYLTRFDALPTSAVTTALRDEQD